MSPPRRGGPIERVGYFDSIAERAKKFRVRVRRVESHEKYSLLRLTITHLGEETATGSGYFGYYGSFSGFDLLDPVGRRIYFSLREERSGGEAFGSRRPTSFDGLRPGVHYQAVVYFPPLPKDTKRVTVLTPGTTAEMTGVPVVTGAPAPKTPTRSPRESPRPGQTVTLPVTPLSGKIWKSSVDLYSSVRTGSRTESSGGDEHVTTLPSDVLFAFDSAKLSKESKDLIAEAAARVRRQADPSEPVHIEGHTDGKGEDSYNKKLSLKRAKAVRDALTRSLSGASFTYQVLGKGETEPLVEEHDADDRARNRRVEISYAVKPPQRTTGRSSANPAGGGPYIGKPAPFRAEAGRVVGQAKATVKQMGQTAHFGLTVHPFYRDGAYLVAVFDLIPKRSYINSAPDYFASPMSLIGADFGSFAVVNPKTEKRYTVVREGPEHSIHYVEGAVTAYYPGMSDRTFVYYPAPPPSVTSVTFDAGPFGKIKDVPIA